MLFAVDFGNLRFEKQLEVLGVGFGGLEAVSQPPVLFLEGEQLLFQLLRFGRDLRLYLWRLLLRFLRKLRNGRQHG